MVTTILIVYLIGVVIAWLYAGYLTGRQFHRFARVNPNQPIQINWVSIFYQGLVWIGFWASFFGERIEQRHPTNTGPDINEVNKRMRELAKERK
jgi:hypothetical protein